MLLGAPLGDLELRRASDGAVRLAGRFPYNSRAILSNGGRSGGRPQKESIASRAFAYRVEDPKEDIHLLVGHSYDKPLASKLTGSLSLTDTAAALIFAATLVPAVAATTHARDALAQIESGLATGISPGFRIPPPSAVKPEDAEEVIEEDPKEGRALIRIVKQALLYELSIVTRPAYPDAQIQMRNWKPTETPDAGLRRFLRWRA